MKTKDLVVLITGGASGLGEATVRWFAAKDNKVVILDLEDEKGNKIANEIGDSALYVKTDVTSEESVNNALDEAIEKFGKIDVAINCAGIGPSAKVVGRKGPFPLETFASVISVNLIGSFNVLRLAAARMVNNTPNEEGERGVIISTSSGAAFEGQIGQCAYSASKGGINAMTLPAARELGEVGIRVVAVAPGTFGTPLMVSIPQEYQDAITSTIPFPKRFGKPDEYAHCIDFIVSNPVMNGCVLRLDGAMRMQAK